MKKVLFFVCVSLHASELVSPKQKRKGPSEVKQEIAAIAEDLFVDMADVNIVIAQNNKLLLEIVTSLIDGDLSTAQLRECRDVLQKIRSQVGSCSCIVGQVQGHLKTLKTKG